MTDLTAAHTVTRVQEWCNKTEAETTEWLKRHNSECHCEVGETYLEAVQQVRELLPEEGAYCPAPESSVTEVLARILDPAAFNPDSKVAASRRRGRQSAARVMADRAIAARYVRERGFWGCACPSCLMCTGRCHRCGKYDPRRGEDLCRRCDREEAVAS